MDQEVANQVMIGQGWVVPLSIITAVGGTIVAVIKSLYSDMRKDKEAMLKKAQEREDKLMHYLEEKNKTDLQMSLAMQSINKRLEHLESKAN